MSALKGIKSRFKDLIYNRYYYWYVVRKRREKEQTRILMKKYAQKNKHNKTKNSFVINIYEGDIKAGGLADRLRGIVSTYCICKENGLEYKLKFTDPFPLTDFLVPAKYDWTIPDDEVSFEPECVHVVVLDTTQESGYQKRKQESYLKNRVSRLTGQIHVYTNAAFSYNKNYSIMYNELFKPSIRLQETIDKHLESIGERYISVSARFLNLLGDFNEPFGYSTPLSDDEAETLMQNVYSQLERLHKEYPQRTVLVNSDSKRFLEYSERYDYVYIVPGNITHIDNTYTSYSYEQYEKTFLDFYLIANAERIFLIRGKNMFESGYPLAASKIYNKPFDVLEA